MQKKDWKQKEKALLFGGFSFLITMMFVFSGNIKSVKSETKNKKIIKQITWNYSKDEINSEELNKILEEKNKVATIQKNVVNVVTSGISNIYNDYQEKVEEEKQKIVEEKRKEAEALALQNARNNYQHFTIYTNENAEIYDGNYVLMENAEINTEYEVVFENEEYFEITNEGRFIKKDQCSKEKYIIEEPIEKTEIEYTGEDSEEYNTNLYNSSTYVPEKGTINNRWGIDLNEEDKILLAKIIYLEARGESLDGQEAVAEVILNRIVDSRFKASNVYEVVSAPYQFESWGLMNKTDGVDLSVQFKAIDDVLYHNANHIGNRTFFAMSPITNIDVYQIGCHYFSN